MKIIITDVRVRIMGVKGRNWIFVFVETDAGITGVGEATTEYHEQAVAAMIENHLGPRLRGEDALRIEFLWQRGFRQFWWRGGVVATSALSGIDQALWDIAGKAYSLPVYRLLGGMVHERVQLYARGDLGLGCQKAEAEAAIGEGFRVFKTGYIHPSRGLDEEEQINYIVDNVRHIRDIKDPGLQIGIDCGGLFSFNGAVRLARALQPYNVWFLEEPVNADTPRHLAALRQASLGIDIAAGERVMTRAGFREWIELGAVDIIQADICHAGGISELRRIAAMAEVYGIKVAPHNPYGPVAMAAAAHCATATPNFAVLEYCRFSPLFFQIQKEGLTLKDGYLELSERPGLGIEVDEEFIEAHPYKEMQERTFRTKSGAVPLI